MSKYGALFFNQGITEELTPYESAVFLKKIKTKPGIIKVIEGNNNAVPLIFIRVLNSSNPSLGGLSEVIYENNAWCVNLIDTIQGNSAEYELYVFVKSSYHISLHPQSRTYLLYLCSQYKRCRAFRICGRNRATRKPHQRDIKYLR